MRIYYIFLVLFLPFSTFLYSQKIPALECMYKISVRDKDGIHNTLRKYLITSDKIFSFFVNDSSRASLADFKQQTVKVKNINGNVYTTGMTNSRNPVTIKQKKDSINGFVGDYLITNIGGAENISLILDSSTKIPKFKGEGFFDVFDNGLGYLPIKGVKEALSPIEGQGNIIWTISLLSKKVIEVDSSLLRVE